VVAGWLYNALLLLLSEEVFPQPSLGVPVDEVAVDLSLPTRVRDLCNLLDLKDFFFSLRTREGALDQVFEECVKELTPRKVDDAADSPHYRVLHCDINPKHHIFSLVTE